MPSNQPQPGDARSAFPFGAFTAASEYWIDAAQRSILFWDVMRERGNAYREHLVEIAPNVLDYQVELLLDGRTFARPVNYVLVRVIPPQGTTIDQTRRPFVTVDPRAGHGPGIGGFKSDSEIGVALKAGHPCYFIGFLPDPMPGQTIEDIARAEASFLEKVSALHPAADGKPCVIGNCQAGWAIMMLSSVRPELFGPIISPDRRCPIGMACAAKIRCAIRAGFWVAAGSPRSRRPRRREIRRRLAGAEFRESKPVEHVVDQAI